MWFTEFNHSSTEEWFDLTAWWRCTQICHACTLTKWNFIRVPNPLKNVPRRDYDNFMQHATQPGEKSSWAEIGVALNLSNWTPWLTSNMWTLFFTWGVLTKLNFFDPMQIKFCSMHSLNLGVSTWMAAGALIVLKEDLQLWGGNDRDPSECFYDAWVDFRNWAKRNKIQRFDCT